MSQNRPNQLHDPDKTNPLPPKTGDQALDELALLRHEFSEFRKDFKKLNNELSLRIAFGIIGSVLFLLLFRSCEAAIFHL